MKRLGIAGLVLTLMLTTLGGAAQEAPTIDVAEDPNLGQYLIAANGRTLYQLTKDKENESVCFEECANVWMPFTAEEPLVLPEGVDGELTLIERDANDENDRNTPGEGSSQGEEGNSRETNANQGTQVAYNGIPLYFYAEDIEPGDVNGQGVDGVWFVVTPGQQYGDALATPQASPAASPEASPAA